MRARTYNLIKKCFRANEQAYVASRYSTFILFQADAREKMAYSRLLKINLVLLVLVIICVASSVFALYIGNTKFI